MGQKNVLKKVCSFLLSFLVHQMGPIPNGMSPFTCFILSLWWRCSSLSHNCLIASLHELTSWYFSYQDDLCCSDAWECGTNYPNRPTCGCYHSHQMSVKPCLNLNLVPEGTVNEDLFHDKIKLSWAKFLVTSFIDFHCCISAFSNLRFMGERC